MVTFILNNTTVSTDKPSGSTLLDFIRTEMGLKGTKAGCREGDCGACTVLLGTLEGNKMIYKNIVACLTPIGNIHRCHIVTIEGINGENLTIVQKAVVENAATQCGFCTPGFVMSLTSDCLSENKSDSDTLINAVSGNICRCTGYKSIERAASEIAAAMREKDQKDPVRWLVSQNSLPGYFLTIPERLMNIPEKDFSTAGGRLVAGGTDLYVREADALAEKEIASLYRKEELTKTELKENSLTIGTSLTINELKQSEIISESYPGIISSLESVASEPVRNMATIGGNIVNASPIADFTIILLALNADVTISSHETERTIALKNLYKGYKKLDLKENEYLRSVRINIEPSLFSFEKISKRKHLDIASVNSAMTIITNGKFIEQCTISAGGVSPVPLTLVMTSAFLTGKTLCPDLIVSAVTVMEEEISPISDIRGSAGYKRLLLRQLLFAHFIKLFPDVIKLEDLI